MTQPAPPPLPQAAVLSSAAVLQTYQQSTDALIQQIVQAVTQLWGQLTSWRQPDIEQFAKAVVPIVNAGQIRMASLTEAYLDQYRSIETGKVYRPEGLPPRDVSGSKMRLGTDPVEVYKRSGKEVYKRLANGASLEDAVQSGLDRAVKAAKTDLQLTKTHVSQDILSEDDEIVGWRRVLEGDYSCALCIVASTQRYHKKDLMAIHPGCDCAVAPLYEEQGQVIDLETLNKAHDLIKQTFGTSDRGARSPEYRKLVIVHDHGELGPILGVRGQHFDKPSDFAKDKASADTATNPDRGTKSDDSD